MATKWCALKRILLNQQTKMLPRSLQFAVLPSCTVLLHLLLPGGIVGSHRALLVSLSAILCLIHCTHLSLHQSFWSKALNSCCILSAGTCVLFVTSILFGAHPLRFLDTFSWSFFMTVLLFVPVVDFIGCKSKKEMWIRVFLECRLQNAQERSAYVTLACTLLGAWVGAFPILLDWNRPWQVWPIPCSVGALLGHLTGCVGTQLLSPLLSDKKRTLLS